MIRAALERFLSPGYSTCYRCHRPWKFVTAHVTRYEAASSCFPLCESCWGALTVAERIPYYHQLWVGWSPGYASWGDIETAVRAGG
jgi:hypothetical protein